MADNVSTSTSSEATPGLRPRGKIAIPEVFTRSSSSNGPSESMAPAAERTTSRENGSSSSPAAAAVEPAAPPASSAAVTPAEASPAPAEEAVVAVPPATGAPARAFDPISPGLSGVKLPLGPSPKKAESAPPKEVKEEPPVEAKVGDLVELFMGKGQVRAIREEDGMLEVWAMGWEMAGEQRPRYFVQRGAVKVVKTVYYQMPVLERLQIAAWLKGEGAKLFKAGDYDKAAQQYMKSIGVLKTCEFKTNAHNARALELMIPCHNNAATCYIKRKNYGDARLLTENVDTLCSALDRNRGGMVMKALKERGVGETTILGQWWCKGLFLGGKACLYQGENEEAVNCLRKGSKLAKPAALKKLRAEINNELEKATARLASQTKKAQKMWSKAFSKNSTEAAADEESNVSGSASGKRALPSVPAQRTATNGTNGAGSGGGPNKSVLERLEELTKMGGVAATPGLRNAVKQAKDEEEDEDSEEEYDEDEDDDESLSLASSGLLWGSVAVGAVAVGVAALLALGKRR